MDMTEIRRRSMMSPKSSPQARDYSERGIEACLAVNPLGSIEFQSPSRPKSPLLDGTDPSFWNENWRSTEEDGSIHPDRSEQRVVDDDQEIGFYPPRKFGQRNVNLTAYWSSRFIKAVVTLAATMCIVLAIFRILATMVFLKSDSMFWLLPYFVTLSFISLCIASVHLQDYFERPNEYDTRFLAFLGLFSLHGITDWVKFGFGGALTAWIFAAQLGAYYEGPFLFSRELNKPSKSTTYLNEELFYVIMAGSWVGSYFFLQRHFDISRPFIKFPVVHRRKILEFKSKARPTLKKSARAAIWPTITFTISYHFFFYDIKNSVVSALMFLDSCALEIDHTWYEFLNLRRLFVVYLVSVVVIFLFKMAKGVIRIFLLAPREFGVELFHEEQLELTLTEALGESRLPLVRALAFRYLLEIARSSDAVGKDRRRKIFALNPTGDLPLEWNATKGDCLSCVERFTALLDEFQELVDTRMNDDVAPVLPWQLALQAIHLKNKRERLSECRKAMSLLERLTFESKQILVRMPWLMYILDNRKQNAFIRATRNCQEVLYSVRALSCLVANSVAEDRYGVVQRDVPRILKSLSALRDRLLLFRRISEQCAAYSVFVHRSLVRIWLAFPDSFGAEGLKHYR